jgi:diguanylate cyclase (GGDEF)-like protein
MLVRAAALAQAGAWRCELADQRLAWTPAVFDLFGIDPARSLDRREAVERYTPESRQTMERLRAAAIERGTPFTFDAELAPGDGPRRWIRVWGEVERRHGRAVALNGWKQDVTAERAAIAALRERADRDALTGLANRAAFRARLEAGDAGALLLLDLDGFKGINDAHGHAAGDACLAVVGERLASAFGDAQIAARLGGDEFAILLPDASEARLAAARRIGRRAQMLALPVEWDGRLLHFGVSGGLAFADARRLADPDAWMRDADGALYAAKRLGKGRIRIA